MLFKSLKCRLKIPSPNYNKISWTICQQIMPKSSSSSSSDSPVECSICRGTQQVLANPHSRLKAFLRNNVPEYQNGSVCHACYMKLKRMKEDGSAEDSLDRIVNQKTPLAMKVLRTASQETVAALSSHPSIVTPSSEGSLSAPMPRNVRFRTPDISLLLDVSRESAELQRRGVTANDFARNNGG